MFWHDHRYVQAMHDVIIQVSDDPEFKQSVTTLFNNDTDNSTGLGPGTDREYFETAEGRRPEAVRRQGGNGMDRSPRAKP